MPTVNSRGPIFLAVIALYFGALLPLASLVRSVAAWHHGGLAPGALAFGLAGVALLTLLRPAAAHAPSSAALAVAVSIFALPLFVLSGSPVWVAAGSGAFVLAGSSLVVAGGLARAADDPIWVGVWTASSTIGVVLGSLLLAEFMPTLKGLTDRHFH